MAERFRQNDRRVIFARLDPPDRRFFIRKDPVQLVVLAQVHLDLIADIQRDREQTSPITLVHIGDRDLEVSGVAVRIPTGGDIEPGVQRRNDRQAHDHDPGDRIVADLFQITGKDLTDIAQCLHGFSSPFSSCSRSSLDFFA